MNDPFRFASSFPGAALFAVALAVTVGALLFAGGRDTAQAGNPTPTPKFGTAGSLSGIADILLHENDKNVQFAYCKTRTDHDALTNEIKTASTCYFDAPGLDDPDSVVPDDTNIDLSGPPPPPPYGYAAPAKGNGAWDPGTDELVWTVCFPSLGGVIGPNIIGVVTIQNAKATLPNQSGVIDIYYGQGIDECEAKVPKGIPTLSLPLNVTTYDTPPYDNVTSIDSDDDGCADAFELDKQRPKKDCGDDPWNPHDSDLNFTASFSIMTEIIRADTCQSGLPAGAPPFGCDGESDGALAAGSYVHCQAFLDHNTANNSVTGKMLCYIDNPETTVNIEDVRDSIKTHAGTPTPEFTDRCVPFVLGGAPKEFCGDGLPGAGPPNPLGDNDGDDAADVTGVLDKIENRLLLDVCFAGIENPNHGPNIYARIDIDAHTGLGTIDIWYNRPDCSKPATAPSAEGAIAMGEQNDANCSFTTSHPECYDIDSDGCSARQELGSNVNLGGQRDPFSKFDHMDMNKDGTINIPNDILIVAQLFGPQPPFTQGDVGRTMTGSVQWAHRSADGTLGIPDDTLGMAAQFGHNCT